MSVRIYTSFPDGIRFPVGLILSFLSYFTEYKETKADSVHVIREKREANSS